MTMLREDRDLGYPMTNWLKIIEQFLLLFPGSVHCRFTSDLVWRLL